MTSRHCIELALPGCQPENARVVEKAHHHATRPTGRTPEDERALGLGVDQRLPIVALQTECSKVFKIVNAHFSHLLTFQHVLAPVASPLRDEVVQRRRFLAWSPWPE